MKLRAAFLKKTSKVDTPLVKLRKGGLKIRNKNTDITTDAT